MFTNQWHHEENPEHMPSQSLQITLYMYRYILLKLTKSKSFLQIQFAREEHNLIFCFSPTVSTSPDLKSFWLCLESNKHFESPVGV